MGDEPEDVRTLKQKLLFYTTAFFILLGTFSLFAFLFLVPFVIDPAFTTIFMQFDEKPAYCVTIEALHLVGAKNCSQASCREGCTKDVYECTQIFVNYKRHIDMLMEEYNGTVIVPYNMQKLNKKPGDVSNDPSAGSPGRYERAIRDYDYADQDENALQAPNTGIGEMQPFVEVSDLSKVAAAMENQTEWYFVGARLYPNVKGCGYPPMLNCTIWHKKYDKEGNNFTCYYSTVDPKHVITDLDMWQNTLNLVYSMAIPIPSFIISVIYLTYAYFKIYNEDEETAPLDKNAEGMAGDDEDEDGEDVCVDVVIPNGATSLSASGPLTPNSEMNSFGHQLKVKMADEMSRESLDGGVISNSGSLQGNLSKTMTTSISTPPGPTAAV